MAATILLWAGSALSACDSDPFQGELTPCRCEVDTCAPTSCRYELRMDGPSCQGQFSGAEILIDGHLETEVVTPGGSVFPCSRTDLGQASELWVRGGPWIWGPLTERCSDPGDTRLLLFQCVEAQ